MAGVILASVGANYGPPPNPPPTVEVLVIGGGGSGGGGSGSETYWWGGSGGGGGFVYIAAYSTPSGTQTVTVGGSDSNSSFATITALGGGYGGSFSYFGTQAGSGGSGGGGGPNLTSQLSAGGTGLQPSQAAPSGSPNGFGFNGGSHTGGGTGAGGGGAGGAGADGGSFGPGRANSISGTSVTYASSAGLGYPPTSGAANTGNAGQGTRSNEYPGGSGGSGIVIIKYSTAYDPATTTGGVTYTVSGGSRLYTFTGSGSIKF